MNKSTGSNGETVFICPHCGSKYASGSGIRYHLEVWFSMLQELVYMVTLIDLSFSE
ncbi:hypothetical protein BC829DRAFT_411128 [Chytridium lagenaria]|nr:hypothetical protein BC829DRAFT_411128 [Chytridium lagenaria]